MSDISSYITRMTWHLSLSRNQACILEIFLLTNIFKMSSQRQKVDTIYCKVALQLMFVFPKSS